MRLLRSFIFNFVFYVGTALRMIVLSPFYFSVSRERAYRVVVQGWGRFVNRQMRWWAGATFEIEGLEHLPDGPCIIVPKHQSAWDTILLLPWIPDSVFMLKRELIEMPLFGWYLKKQRQIAVDRAAKGRNMADAILRTKAEVETGRQLIIFPEGTRRPPGALPEYKRGIQKLYANLDIPVIPVVMHPGLFWPRGSFWRYGGHFKVRVLEPIAPGMEPKAFFTHLVETMERESDQLLLETVAANPQLPLPEITQKRVDALKKNANPLAEMR
ncbi:lysophospholipid acyltransferase family protein [Martelella mediterranea]|uniref:1-acyl-sn-glycerol-3-phosphate acyltransferase n=1 Tax=Martelella mediterranea TaxID=293089 RepID=A0A4R3NYS3_9HYPH|nr:lysophospholipid acyltransferase family protein [Martelella mediterranea]TCT45110.1 1-acyl-sn-glycerol-3-phosphate acyltransferase [Martelella mediterranea]